jgi:hypothetical protein
MLYIPQAQEKRKIADNFYSSVINSALESNIVL